MPSLLPSSSTSDNNRVLREVGQTCPYHPQCLLNDTVPIRTHVRSLRGEEHIFNLSLLSDKRCWTMWKQKNVRSSGDYWSVNEPPSCRGLCSAVGVVGQPYLHFRIPTQYLKPRRFVRIIRSRLWCEPYHTIPWTASTMFRLDPHTASVGRQRLFEHIYTRSESTALLVQADGAKVRCGLNLMKLGFSEHANSGLGGGMVW